MSVDWKLELGSIALSSASDGKCFLAAVLALHPSVKSMAFYLTIFHRRYWGNLAPARVEVENVTTLLFP